VSNIVAIRATFATHFATHYVALYRQYHHRIHRINNLTTNTTTMTHNITIPRGQNIGRTIINDLKASYPYQALNIATFDIKRDVKAKTIKVTLTLKTK